MSGEGVIVNPFGGRLCLCPTGRDATGREKKNIQLSMRQATVTGL